MALETAAKLARRPKVKQPVPVKRPVRRPAVVQPPIAKPMPVPAQPDVTSTVTAGDRRPLVANDIPALATPVEIETPVEAETAVEIETLAEIETRVEAYTPVETDAPAAVNTPPVDLTESDAPLSWLEGSAEPATACEAVDTDAARGERRNLVQKVRDWLRRAA
jgi:8-oxo-dGTP diphosphatase